MDLHTMTEMEHAIKYIHNSSVFWLIIGIIFIAIAIVLIIGNTWEIPIISDIVDRTFACDESLRTCICILLILGLIIFSKQVCDIIKCNTYPEEAYKSYLFWKN